jgi:hypothetical protein
VGVLLWSAFPPVAAAATYYVATTGEDNRSCTTAQALGFPKKTILSGLACLRAGDTLYLRGGTYLGPIDSNRQTIPVGTSWSSPVTISAYPGETVILRASSPGVVNLAHSYIQYLIFNGLIIDGAQIGGVGTAAVSLWGGAHHVRFINTEIRNSPYQGITIFWGNGRSSDYNEFINCKVHSNGRTNHLDHGFYISTSNNLIEGCQIYNNKAFGVHIYSGSASQSANRNVVRGNRIYNNGTTGANGGGVVSGSGTGALLYNNLIYGNRDGIVMCCGAKEQQVLNNTIYGNLGFGIEIQGGYGHSVVNNILRLNSGGDTRFYVSVPASNNVTVDPVFVNASGADFRLQPSSPAINAGTALSTVTTDFAQVPRPQGGAHDVGALEYR